MSEGGHPAEKVAVVTGAGSGIGRVSALALAGDGFSVVCAGRRRPAIEDTRAEIEAAGGEATSVVTDISDEASVVGLFAEAQAAYGRVDVLFNNAGVFGSSTPLTDITLEAWERVVATNLTGTFLCTREAFRVMRDQDPQGGRIINNGSISALSPRPNSFAYTATKHAVTGLTKSTSLDGRPYHIACGQIDIGNARTPPRPGSEVAAPPRGSGGSDHVMDSRDVGRAVSYMASLPLDANVLFMTVMATAMPYIGRG